jgi:glycosyltransferase involved in cell wall biosynthesis
MAAQIKATAVMCFSDDAGGMVRSALRLAEILARAGVDVTLVCKSSTFAERMYRQGEYCFACETINFSSRTFSPVMLFRARSILKSRKISNVIFLGASEMKTLFLSFSGLELNVVVWHGTTKSNPKRDLLHRLVYACVDYHVAISDHLLRNVQTIVPVNDSVRFVLIRPSFDLEPNSTLARNVEDEKFLRIVHVGRVAEGKGQIDAVSACARLYENGVPFRLDIVGAAAYGDAYAKSLYETVEDADYRDSVSINGYVEDVAAFMKAADIFLFPSLGEGMPGVFIEALHYGLVCVAYDNTVFPEFAAMGFHVNLASNGDVDDLADKLYAMACCIDDEKQRALENVPLATEYFQTERELEEWNNILV